MASQAIRAVVALQGTTGSPLDRYLNTFHFNSPDPLVDADLDNLAGHLVDFYTDIPVGGGGSIGGLLSEQVAGSGHTVTFYNVTSLPAGLPIRTPDTWSFAVAPSTNGIPEECALCLSFAAAPVAGNNSGPGPHLPARRRGRVYIGPLNTAVPASGTGGVRPAAGLQADMLLSAEQFLHDGPLADGWIWAVFSPTDLANRAVERAWVDDAFDTQRRRGVAPSGRLSVSF